MIVVDTNIIAYFIIDTNQSAAARRALRQDTEWMLPPRWRSEFRSVLHKRIGAGLLELEEAGRLHARAVMKFGAFERQPDTRRVLRFAREYKIDVYDAEFVALADEYEVALLTADEASLASRVPDRLVLRLSSFL